jgi:hypothetical protein
MEQQVEIEVNKDCLACKRCSDFDKDCQNVEDHVSCYLGGETDKHYTPPADGYCPFIHKFN